MSFLYGKFLADDSGSADSPEGEIKTGSRKGQTVDFVIKDEELPSDEITGQYIVNESQHKLSPNDIKGVNGVTPEAAQNAYAKQQSVGNEIAKNAVMQENVSAGDSVIESSGGGSEFSDSNNDSDKKFVPVRNIETLYNVSGKEAVPKNGAPVNSSFGEDTYSAEDEQLDTLPSMDSIGDLDSSGPAFGDGGVNNDTDFANGTGGGSSRHAVEPDENTIKDAPLLAKAISTILANES